MQKSWFQSYLNEKGELAYAFPTRLNTSLEVFDWLFTEKPEEGFEIDRFQNQLICISGYSQSNGLHKEKVSQCYLVKCYKDGFLFLYCLNDLTWSHYAIPRSLQKYAPNISRSIFDIYTGERFDFHILRNGMVLTVLAQYATSCVTLHNAVLWHPVQPGFPPSRRICAVEVVKMSNCYRCQQSPNKCQCLQNSQRITLSYSTDSNGTKLSNKTDNKNGANNNIKDSSSSTLLRTDRNNEKSSSTRLHYVVDPNTIKTLFGPWKGTKRVMIYNSNTGQVEREQMSFFRLKLDWAAAFDVRQVQTRVVMGLFNNLFNPISDQVLSLSENDEESKYQDSSSFKTRNTFTT